MEASEPGKCSCKTMAYVDGIWQDKPQFGYPLALPRGTDGYCYKCGDHLLPSGVAEPRLERLLVGRGHDGR